MEQAANQFAKGLQLDTHPMVQGNDTMSDCLNGTFVTMNGDEVILQNDMGNRKVDNAFLPAGYEPVGIKEYGGIIYLALYNPITNKSQLGSFPSPERIINSPYKYEDISLNIKTQELSDTDYFDSEFDVKNSGKIYFLKNNQKLIPLTKDSIRAGDKFVLGGIDIVENNNWDSEIKLSNFNNIEGEKVKSPKNNYYTLKLGVFNSENEFVDITNSLLRWSSDGNINTELDNITDILKFNTDSFVKPITSSDSDPFDDEQLLEERQAVPSNTYSYKLVSPIYLNLVYNTIQRFNYKIYIQKASNENQYNIIIEGTFVYNCPDGINTGDTGDDVYAHYYQGDLPNNNDNLGIDLYIKKDNQYELINGEISSESNSTVYDPESNLYTAKRTFLYKNQSGIFDNENNCDFFIGVKSGFTTEVDNNNSFPIYIENLSDSDIINKENLDSGEISLSEYRYYVNNSNDTEITYKFRFYPKYGINISNFKLQLREITNDDLENLENNPANANTQDSVVNDEDDIISNDQQTEHNSSIIENLSNQIYSGLTDIPIKDMGEGYIIVNNENDNPVNDVDDYQILTDLQGNEYIIDQNGYIEYHKPYIGNIQIIDGGLDLTTPVENQNNQENPQQTENSNNLDQWNDYYEIMLPEIANGRFTINAKKWLHYTINSQNPVEDTLTDGKMYAARFVYTCTNTVEQEETKNIQIERFLLNTALFNPNYYKSSPYYISDYKILGISEEPIEPETRAYRYVYVNFDNVENINTQQPTYSYVGQILKPTEGEQSYTSVKTTNYNIAAQANSYIKNKNLYPDYIQNTILNNPTSEIEQITSDQDLITQINWINWEESRPSDLITTTINNMSIQINNKDYFKGNGKLRWVDINDLFVELNEAFYKEFLKVKTYSGIVMTWAAHSGDPDEHKVRMYTEEMEKMAHRTGGYELYGVDTDSIVHFKLDWKKNGTGSSALNSFYTNFNNLNTTLAYIFETHGDTGRYIVFAKQDRPLGQITYDYWMKYNSTQYARLWWRCSDLQHWVPLTITNSNFQLGTEIDGISNDIYSKLFQPNSLQTINNKAYVCYYKTSPQQVYVPIDNKKYNEEYENINWQGKINYTLNKNSINLKNPNPNILNKYFIPKFITTPVDYIYSSEFSLNISSNYDFQSLITSEFNQGFSQVLITEDNIFITDSDGNSLSKEYIYYLENNQLKKLNDKIIMVSNSEQLGATNSEYALLCNSYKSYPIDTSGTGNQTTSNVNEWRDWTGYHRDSSTEHTSDSASSLAYNGYYIVKK